MIVNLLSISVDDISTSTQPEAVVSLFNHTNVLARVVVAFDSVYFVSMTESQATLLSHHEHWLISDSVLDSPSGGAAEGSQFYSHILGVSDFMIASNVSDVESWSAAKQGDGGGQAASQAEFFK